MKVMYKIFMIILIGIIVAAFVRFCFYQSRHELSGSSRIAVDINFIQQNYDALISGTQSPEFVRAIHENGFACYHAGIVFPWDSKQIEQKKHVDITSAWRVAECLELNRDYYGFLFLGNPTVKSRILDAGCGGGTSSILMEKMFNCYVDGYSLAKKEIEHAQATAILHHSSDKLRFFQGNILTLPESDNTYDVIWISESSEYIASIVDFFGEMKRVGKDRTRVVLFTWTSVNAAGKKQMDGLYRTTIHSVEEYLVAANQQSLQLVHQQNLRDWMVPYFNFIVRSKLYREEKELIQMFLSGQIDYYLLCFDIEK